jgi:uridine kinase
MPAVPVPLASIILIAGGTASGKTTLARSIHSSAPGRVRLIQLDSYYRQHPQLTKAERDRLNFDHPEAFDFDLLVEHVEALRNRRSAHIPIYDFATHQRQPATTHIEPGDVIVVEGILALHHAALRAVADATLFIDAPSENRLERRRARDIAERGRTRESVLRQWHETVLPMHDQFCEPSRSFAHAIYDQATFHEALPALLTRFKLP